MAAARRRRPGWFVHETYVKVSGRWMYLHRAIDQHGQVIDVLLSPTRDLPSAGAFFTDHGRLKARLRPMRGLKRERTAQTIAAGHALVQNLRPGHQFDHPGDSLTLVQAFNEIAEAI